MDETPVGGAADETRVGETADEARVDETAGETGRGEAPEPDARGAEAPEADARGTEATGAEAPGDEERVRALIDELRRLKVEDLVIDMAVSLVTVGYQKLGLTEQTRELRDLRGARLAIEVLRAHLDVLEREGAAVKLGDLRSTLAAMQLSYARAVAEQAGEGGAAPEGKAGAEAAAGSDTQSEDPGAPA